MDIAADPDFLVTMGDGDGIVVRPVSHQGQGVDPRAPLVASVERRRRQRHQRRAVTRELFADALAVAARNIALPVAATRLQGCIEGIPALVTGKRRHEVPPGIADHPFHIAFVIALAGTAITIFEEVMRLKPTERRCSLPHAVRQDARYQALVVVVEDRLGNAPKEGEGPVMTVQPGFRRRRRVGAHEASVAVRKRHDEEMRPMLHPGDERIRLAKVRLSMAWRMRQRHEHLPVATAPFANVILDDGLSAREAMLIAKTFEDPLRRVALLTMDPSTRIRSMISVNGSSFGRFGG